MSHAEQVLVSIENHIATVTLNRPEKHNGLNMDMFEQVTQAARQIKADKRVRCVILQGAGPSFCAGLDFKAVTRKPSSVARLFLKFPWGNTNLAQRIAHCWQTLPVPVIAVLHGNCFGGGLQIALACDFRIAHPDTALSVMEIKWGLIPDMSGTVNFSRLTRIDIAKELTMTGRQFSAAEAKSYGLVTATSSEPQQKARQLAEQIASQSPDAIVATKTLFNRTWQATASKALRLERWIQSGVLGRKNQKIAMANGLSKDKQKPFVDRK